LVNHKFWKARKLIHERLARVFVWLALFSVVSSFAVPQTKADTAPDLTFCPLTKTWVLRAKPPQSSVGRPLKDICATSDAKQKFLLRSIQALLPSKQTLTSAAIQKLFFDYAKKGNRAFSAVSGSTNDPASQLTQFWGPQKSAITIQSDFCKKQTEVCQVTTGQDPLIDYHSNAFEWSRITETFNIPANNRSRAPPFSL
jgi:hypothetical protein